MPASPPAGSESELRSTPSLGQVLSTDEDGDKPLAHPEPLHHVSAPAVLGPSRLPTPQPEVKQHQLSWDDSYLQKGAPAARKSSEEFELDENAPLRAVRKNTPLTSETDTSEQSSLLSVRGEQESPYTSQPTSDLSSKTGSKQSSNQAIRTDLTNLSQEIRVVAPDSVTEEEQPAEPTAEGAASPSQFRDEAWGDSFKIDWIKTTRVPFTRTRHLRNPWNHGREIKVSRDGTEVEPSVGQRLLDEWDDLCDPPPPTKTHDFHHPPTKTASAPDPIATPRGPRSSDSASSLGVVVRNAAQRPGRSGASDGAANGMPSRASYLA